MYTHSMNGWTYTHDLYELLCRTCLQKGILITYYYVTSIEVDLQGSGAQYIHSLEAQNVESGDARTQILDSDGSDYPDVGAYVTVFRKVAQL